MNPRHIFGWCVALSLLGLGTAWARAAQPRPADPEEAVQVLTRGPVHEAFAETVVFDPQPGIVASKAPPAAIEELPPDRRPEGANVAWIPGYWGWDDERSDFLWISGIWRALPPGRQWLPGYWGNSGQGVQWTSGYWADAKVSEVEYLPEPPATVEVGPNIAAPSADNTWLPGSWVWHQSRYAWRPGFWATVQPDWVWVPAHYLWAPRGYVFVDGYWDYSVDRRGVLFAPVYFGAGAYGRRGFPYSPTTVIALSVFSNHLFLRPRYQHYYFGDYYATNYQAAGFYPSFSYSHNSGRYGYDPIYAHERWQHRQDGQWEQRVAADFQNRRDHEDARPPRTWTAQRLLSTTEAASREKRPVVATPLDQLTKSKDSRLRFEPLDAAERQKLAQRGQEVQTLREERRKLEAAAVVGPAEKPSKELVPPRVRLPASPIVAKSAAELGKDHVPPKIYQAPKLDPKVASGPRVTRSAEQPKQRTVNRPPLDQPQPKPEPRPKADRAAPQPRGNAPARPQSAGPKEDERNDKGKAK